MNVLPVEQRRQRLTIRLHPEMLEKLEKKAEANGKTKTYYVEKGLQVVLNEENEDKGE